MSQRIRTVQNIARELNDDRMPHIDKVSVERLQKRVRLIREAQKELFEEERIVCHALSKRNKSIS